MFHGWIKQFLMAETALYFDKTVRCLQKTNSDNAVCIPSQIPGRFSFDYSCGIPLNMLFLLYSWRAKGRVVKTFVQTSWLAFHRFPIYWTPTWNDFMFEEQHKKRRPVHWYSSQGTITMISVEMNCKEEVKLRYVDVDMAACISLNFL